MPTNISPSESEGTKWMKLQLWVRQACENAGITAGGDDPLLSDISPSDSEGVKWAKLQRWVALLAENISGGDVPSATLADEITTDAPTAYWQLTETGGNLADSAGGGRTLTVTGSPVYAFCQLVRNSTSKGLKFVNGAYASRASDNLGVTPPWTGSWSVEFVVMLPENLEEELGCFAYGACSLETEASNYQIYASILPDRRPSLIWEYAKNVVFRPQTVLPIGFKAHIVWTKDAVNKIVKCFVNGICVYSSEYTQEPTGGSSSVIDVGRSSTGTTATGVLGHVAVYMGAVLSDARVMAHAVAAGVA